MATCMRLYQAPETDLRTFEVAPLTLRAWLGHPRSSRDVSLHDYWRGLDAILAGIPASRSRSWLTPAGADFVYQGAADHGAHALASESTAALLGVIDQVTTHEVVRYVRQQWELEMIDAGHAPDLSAEQLVAAAEELELFFAPLRESCARAVEKRYGLVMALWDGAHVATRPAASPPRG